MRQSATALGTGGSAAGPGGVRRIARWLRRAAGVVRAVVGAPDYDRYVAHMCAHHPECELVSRDEFMRQRLECRYSRPGARCC